MYAETRIYFHLTSFQMNRSIHIFLRLINTKTSVVIFDKCTNSFFIAISKYLIIYYCILLRIKFYKFVEYFLKLMISLYLTFVDNFGKMYKSQTYLRFIHLFLYYITNAYGYRLSAITFRCEFTEKRKIQVLRIS